MNQKCNVCKKTVLKIKSEKLKESFRYRDEFGRRWEGNLCPSCVLYKQTKRRHAAGGSRFYNPIPIHAKGIQSENIIKELFEKDGYDVKQSALKGPDLIISKLNKSITCEVKSIIKCLNAKSWYVAPISVGRKNDDFVALVLDENNIVFEKMNDHLRKCTKSGRRNLTKEVKEMTNTI